MTKTRNILVLIFAMILCNCSIKNTNGLQNNNIASSQSFVFPDDWLGYWKGDLKIYSSEGLTQVLPMAVDHSKTDSMGVYTWALIYGTDTVAGRRNYVLRELDKTKGHYVTDEQNGIYLDSYVLNNELMYSFEVMGNTLSSCYRREGNHMYFEILMYKSSPNRISGNIIHNGDTIPEVKSYPVVVRQKAKLTRSR